MLFSLTSNKYTSQFKDQLCQMQLFLITLYVLYVVPYHYLLFLLVPHGNYPTDEDCADPKRCLYLVHMWNHMSNANPVSPQQGWWPTPSRQVSVALQTPWQTVNQVQKDLANSSYLVCWIMEEEPFWEEMVGSLTCVCLAAALSLLLFNKNFGWINLS